MKPDYTLKPTIAQTLKANASLEKAERNKRYLYDFAILCETDIDEPQKQEIKAQVIKYSDIVFRDGMVCSPYDICTSFNYYSGNFYVKAYPCYTEDGKQKYIIMRLVKLDITFQERTCIYDEFQVTKEIHECCDVDYEIEELNIA